MHVISEVQIYLPNNVSSTLFVPSLQNGGSNRGVVEYLSLLAPA